MSNVEDTNNSSDLSEFFSALSKEKKETRQKLEEEIANPESGLSNLFQQLEEVHRETQKVSEETSDNKSLSPDDQNKLEAFSSLMNSVDVSLQETQEETTEIIKPPIVAEVFNINSEKETDKLETFSKLFDGLAKVEEKQEPQKELVIEGEAPKPQIVAQETNNIISNVISNLDAMELKTEVKEEVDQITSIRTEFEKFKTHIQQHISNQGFSGGGSGEVRLEFLDDVQSSTAKVNDKFLKYDSSVGKWVGADASGSGSSAADDITAGDAAVLLTTTSGNITIDAAANDTDIIFKGTDGGADITMLTLDGSADGAAIFKSTVTATGFAGALTGNVTGNASGTAATVTGAAQTAITSVGTLTALTVDNVVINGSTIGHGDDTDLMTVANGIVTVAGEVSMTTLDIGGTNVTSTAAELNLLDTASANSVVNSKAVIYGSSGELAGTLSTAAQTNVTSLGTLTALTVDNIVINGANIGHTSDTDALAIDSSGNVTASQNLIVSGDFTVNGTTTTISSTNTVVADNLFELNNGAGSNSNDSGIIIERGSTGDNAIIMWDESADKFQVGTTTATASATGNISVTSGILVASSFEGDLASSAIENSGQITSDSFNLPITLNGTNGSSANGGDNIVQNTEANENDRLVYEDATPTHYERPITWDRTT